MIAELLKFTQTKKHLTGGEVFQNFILTGILAATASTQVIWQAPTSWHQLLMKSSITMSLACLVYHVANGAALARSGKHLRAITGALIVGTPFLFGGLLLLENPSLLQSLSGALLSSDWQGWAAGRELLGRLIVVFLFNEVVANAIGLAAKGTFLRGLKAHGFVSLVSLGVVLSPSVANGGSGAAVAALPPSLGVLAAIVSAMVSQAGLWVEAYFITGMILDGLHGYAPTGDALERHGSTGLRKGLAYSGLFMGFLYGIKIVVDSPSAKTFLTATPLLSGALAGALLFPLLKTIIESFDGSMPFFLRLRYSYGQTTLYLRGAVAGAGFGFGLGSDFIQTGSGDRSTYGFLVGLLASSGVSLFCDGANALRRKGRIQSGKVYLVDGLIGGLIGALGAFYMDGAQVPVIVEKFRAYTSSGLEASNYTIYSLLSKWGRVDLGSYTGGVKLFFNEALAGLITWSIAAPLFAVNRVFMTAYFQRDKAPIRHFFSQAGAVELGVNLIHVMRWGLWMSPIINTGLRLMGQATWYNQDGAIRTLIASWKSLTLSPVDFQAWSLGVFVSLLAFDFLRILIWLDHMGLRVATLVNLSFLGMDKLDEKIARFIGPSAAQRYLPEGVKRFTTWAPLLIPFYLPRGENWDFAWAKSIEIQNASAGGGLTQAVLSLEWHHLAGLFVAGVLLMSALSATVRAFLKRGARRRPVSFELSNPEYKVSVLADGGGHSELVRSGYDLSRRSYDRLDPAGRALFLVNAAESPENPARRWPVFGNFPTEVAAPAHVEKGADSLWVVTTHHGVRTTLQITLPDRGSPAELWTVTLENLGDEAKDLKLVPYLEWVLDRPDSDRGHTQYGRLFPEMEYVARANAIVVNQKKNKSTGFLAADIPTEGFHTSRMDFIGRARSLWSPRLLETLDFLEPKDTAPAPTFDPIGTLSLAVRVEPKASRTLKFLLGSAKNRDHALELIENLLHPQAGKSVADKRKKKKAKVPLIGHGEILPGTPLPYFEYEDGGNTLAVRTPFTPRPYDHALSNGVGHYVMVTNRGLHTTANGNSQQNPVTPDWPDTVTREVPGEAIYLFDADQKEWYSPRTTPKRPQRRPRVRVQRGRHRAFQNVAGDLGHRADRLRAAPGAHGGLSLDGEKQIRPAPPPPGGALFPNRPGGPGGTAPALPPDPPGRRAERALLPKPRERLPVGPGLRFHVPPLGPSGNQTRPFPGHGPRRQPPVSGGNRRGGRVPGVRRTPRRGVFGNLGSPRSRRTDHRHRARASRSPDPGGRNHSQIQKCRRRQNQPGGNPSLVEGPHVHRAGGNQPAGIRPVP
ncbi:MAG: hypothetical protein IPP35_02605 [Elusimicrobia bacterium]|nr:hypothetical protein [Elusimicrobiota bacterium]